MTDARAEGGAQRLGTQVPWRLIWDSHQINIFVLWPAKLAEKCGGGETGGKLLYYFAPILTRSRFFILHH